MNVQPGLALHEMLSHLCTMRPKAIPYQHDGRVQLTQKDPQKVNNQAGVDVAVVRGTVRQVAGRCS